ncbi:hypothetical protein BCR37DRAFT_377991 [Protomyces lactucae-debilis]|uniref:Uncharacterized protein n=1 Tax=Protomyces lactucae-debilis TaxID=2754530 RepID=A0A1Y2FNW1_PROLT|nr:uncharacterized protein BCR37DRAFT_377991 [Protomyces lactucae-debilis]ORY85014.1 hypothetical protein BCR37DRAFT_377991 [Protomyces lactucae-debilis]
MTPSLLSIGMNSTVSFHHLSAISSFNTRPCNSTEHTGVLTASLPASCLIRL